MTALTSAACPRCGAPSAAPRFAPVEARCLGCQKTTSVELPTHGELREVELGIAALLAKTAWLDALAKRDAEGFVIVDRHACEGPLVAPADTPLEATCAHCGEPQRWLLGEQVVDALPASKVSGESWGGGMSLAFKPSLIEASVDSPSQCPGCGAPTPPFRGLHECAHCERTLTALLTCGRRFYVGFDVRGDDEGRPVAGWLPVSTALDHYRRRQELMSRSRWSTLRGIGGGFLAILFFQLLLLVGICLILGFALLLPNEYGGVGVIGVFACLLAVFGGLFIGFFWMLVTRFTKHRRDREELLGGLEPLPRRGLTASGGR